jgi:hypothetical protein
LDELVATAPEWSKPVVAAAIRIHALHRSQLAAGSGFFSSP